MKIKFFVEKYQKIVTKTQFRETFFYFSSIRRCFEIKRQMAAAYDNISFCWFHSQCWSADSEEKKITYFQKTIGYNKLLLNLSWEIDLYLLDFELLYIHS